jgi:hypothetical protein
VAFADSEIRVDGEQPFRVYAPPLDEFAIVCVDGDAVELAVPSIGSEQFTGRHSVVGPDNRL